jgi:hypothetical protein
MSHYTPTKGVSCAAIVSGRLGDSLIGNQRLTGIMLCDNVCP